MSDVIISKQLTDEYIEELNQLPDSTNIIFNSTNGLDADSILKLKDTLNIRVLSAYNEYEDSTYKRDKYVNRTKYTKIELYKIIKEIENIESHINTEWNDLEKAMYVYKILAEGIRFETNKDYTNSKDTNRCLLALLTRRASSAGYSMVYKELLERQGIKCIYQRKESTHSWNLIYIDGEYYPVDLTLDSKNSEKSGKCEFLYFGRDKDFFNKEYHRITTQPQHKTSLLDSNKFNLALNTIRPKKRIEQKMNEIENKNGKKVYFVIISEGKYKRCIAISEGIIKTIIYDDSVNINDIIKNDIFSLDLDEFIFTKDKKKMNELKKHNDKIGLFRRSDGTLFCLRTNGKVTNNSVTHSYMDFEKKDDGMYINASAIISDVNLLEINTFIVQKTADILLSKKRVEDKINKYNGYVGYPEYENGEFKKYVSSSLEETIAGITRESA